MTKTGVRGTMIPSGSEHILRDERIGDDGCRESSPTPEFFLGFGFGVLLMVWLLIAVAVWTALA